MINVFLLVLSDIHKPLCATNEELKIFVVKYKQLISFTWYSITERTSLNVTRTHPQTHREIRQSAHVRDRNNVIDSFVWKMDYFV